MLTTLQRWIAGLLQPQYGRDLMPLVERAIQRIDPRLRALPGYPRNLLPAIGAASRYAGELAASLPEAVPLSIAGYGNTPLMHAIFSGSSAIAEAMGESRALREFAPAGDEVFALMEMRRQEKKLFGHVMDGEKLHHDVAQTWITFTDHTLTLPADNSEAFLRRLEEHLFDTLLHALADSLTSGIDQVHTLQRERDILAAQLRSHSAHGEGAEAHLQRTRVTLQALQGRYNLANYPALISEFMREPQSHLRLERVDMPIDMRGVMRRSDDRLGGDFIFYDLVVRDRLRCTLCPVRMQTSELREAQRRMGDRERRLLI